MEEKEVKEEEENDEEEDEEGEKQYMEERLEICTAMAVKVHSVIVKRVRAILSDVMLVNVTPFTLRIDDERSDEIVPPDADGSMTNVW